MTSASRIWWVHAVLGGVGAMAALAAAAVAVTRIDFAGVSFATLAQACRQWVPVVGSPVYLLLLALGSLGVAALALMVRAATRQLRAGREFERQLAVVGTLPGASRAYVLDDEQPHAFCAGLGRPRIYVSRGALDLLTPAGLAAVIAHEAHHARRRDPLRLLVARSLGQGLFFVPVMRRLTERYAALAELAADEAAVRATRGPQALASALLAFDAHPSPAVVGIAPERIDHLLGHRSREAFPMLLLLVGAAVIATLLLLTVRMAAMAEEASMSLPVLLAQACMVSMAAGPLVLGAGALFGVRRLRGRLILR